MSDQMPMFDDPIPAETPKPPKKPRQKPTKRGAKVAVPKVMKKRRKIRAAKTAVENHAGGRFTDEVYRMIGTLMGMKGSERTLVLDIVLGLTRRAD